MCARHQFCLDDNFGGGINELIVTGVGSAFLPEDYIPYLEICRASTNVAPETRRKTYCVRSAKLTTVYTRAFQKVTGDTEVSGVVFSAGGEVFSSSDQFKLDYVVSVDLVSLEKLLSLQNCSELINSEELARREKAERARLDAQRAEEMTTRAQTAQQNVDNRENIIVTFKNKEGKVLEIKNLEELSQEKLRELGFDVEILKEQPKK